MMTFLHSELSNCIDRESWENFICNRRNIEVTHTSICLHNLFLAVEAVREQYKCLKHITNKGELLCHLWLRRIWVCKLHLHQQGSEIMSTSISALNKAPRVLKSDSHRDISRTGMLWPGRTAVWLDLTEFSSGLSSTFLFLHLESV